MRAGRWLAAGGVPRYSPAAAATTLGATWALSDASRLPASVSRSSPAAPPLLIEVCQGALAARAGAVAAVSASVSGTVRRGYFFLGRTAFIVLLYYYRGLIQNTAAFM
jgi:hypothetical protein